MYYCKCGYKCVQFRGEVQYLDKKLIMCVSVYFSMFNTHCCIRNLYTYAHQIHMHTHRDRKRQTLKTENFQKFNSTRIHTHITMNLTRCGFYKNRTC